MKLTTKAILVLICVILFCCINERVEASSETVIRMVIEIDYPGAIIEDNACMAHPNRRGWKLCYVSFRHNGIFYIAQINVDCRYGDCDTAELFDVISKKDLK